MYILIKGAAMDKILIVEDETMIADILKKFLENKGYLVTYAETAEIALKWVENFRPDLLIVDIGLPDINGIELCKEVRKNIKTRKLPIIIMTGINEIDTKIKGSVEACANLYLQKPVEPQKIFEAASKLIENYKTEKYRFNFSY